MATAKGRTAYPVAAYRKQNSASWGTAISLSAAGHGLILNEAPDFINKPEQMPDEAMGFVFKEYIDASAEAFDKTKLLVTLNRGNLEGSDRSAEMGAYCVSKGVYVGQNGLNKNSYRIDGPRRQFFLSCAKNDAARLFFEMNHSTSDPTTGNLMEVMKSAERINCSYLNVYPEDVLKGTPGQPRYDPAYEEALKYGAQALPRPSSSSQEQTISVR